MVQALTSTLEAEAVQSLQPQGQCDPHSEFQASQSHIRETCLKITTKHLKSAVMASQSRQRVSVSFVLLEDNQPRSNLAT